MFILNKEERQKRAAEYEAYVRDEWAAINDELYDEDGGLRYKNFDALPAALSSRLLTYYRTVGIRLATRRNVARSLIAFETDIDRNATYGVTPVWSGSAMAEWWRAGGQVPNASVGMTEVSMKYDPMVSGFEMDFWEKASAAYANQNVQGEKMQRCYEAIENKIENLVFFGDSTMGKFGLIDHTNIADGNLTNGDWLNATQDEIIEDVHVMLSTIYTACGGRAGDIGGLKFQLLLGAAYWLHINTTKAYPDSDNTETIEQALMRHPLYGGSIECPALDTVAGGSSDYCIVGPFGDAQSIAFKNAYEAEAMTPNNSDPLKTQQTIHAKVGGLQVKYPIRFLQCDGLNV